MPQLSARDILAPIADDMREVDGLIRTRLDSGVLLVRQVADHIVAAGGKRLRPALAERFAQRCTVPPSASRTK
jgi:octaprenyl-diphosphate synthase